jgi:aminopeptidase-like protein
MEEWAKLGDDEHSAMLSYAFIPARSKKTNDLGEHLNHYRDTAFFLHLFCRSINSKSVKDALNTRTDRLPVTIHHFKPSVRAAVERN